MISTIGNVLQVVALIVSAIAAISLVAGARGHHEGLVNAGYLMVFGNAIALTACLGLILVCFLTENYSIAYVVSNYPSTTSALKPLYLVSAVWAGRQGSLLLWTWLISLYAAVVAWKRMHVTDDLSSVALGVTEVIVALFLCTLVFSDSNNPFMPTASEYLNADGTLAQRVGGMNPLLMHWAMILHPPATFIGYAGCALPFAYAMAAIITGDLSARWVELADRLAIFSFIFLTIGMSLGAVWAYVVLGWGGFWGWDAVENASLFSWLTAVAMIHSFTMYRKHGIFRRWSMFAATITFIFVVLGTFITRSGLVQSVHAFAQDQVSTYLFLAIMVVAALAFLIGLLYRNAEFGEDDDQIESLFSKNGSYFITNLVMIVAAVLCAYLTVSSALPSWMPLGGSVVAAGAFNAVARPVGTLFCLLMAVCPMLGWRKTDGAKFARNMRVPAILGAVLFVALMVLFVTKLAPEYDAIVAAGGDAATTLTEQGPRIYYFALTVVAFAAASLLFASSAYLLARGVGARRRNKGENALAALVNLFRRSPAQAGGYLTHLSVAIVLVGLVGSSMYVREQTLNLTATAGESGQVGAYTLTYEDGREYSTTGNNKLKEITLKVTDASGKELGTLKPSLEVSATNTGQQTLHAGVLTFPGEDLFVAFQGLNADGSLSVHVKVNPLILLNWIGGGVAVLGIVLAFAPRRATPLLAADERVRVEAAEKEAVRVERAQVRAKRRARLRKKS